MEFTTGENEKRLLASILKERLIEGKNTVTYKELLEEEMPLFLRNFLVNRVKKYYYTNEPIQFKNSKRYDFNYEKIKILQEELHKAFEEATLFTKEEITEIINRTVGLQFDLLISPHKTLIKIFFKTKSERNQTDILQILTGLSDNRVFIQQLIGDIREFDQFHITKYDFEKLLKNTHQRIFEENFITTFMSDIDTFVEFVGHIKDIEEKKVNKDVLKLLLEERDADKYYEAFDSIEHNELIEIKDVESILDDYINNTNGNDDVEIDADNIEDYIVAPTEEEVESSPEEKVESKKSEKKAETKKHFPVIQEYKDPNDFIIEKSKIESQPKGPLVALKSLIDEKSKKIIKKKIFCKDDIAYNEFIITLEEIDNWKQAKQVIDDELILRSIQPFSREALALGDLVFNRYFPKKT